MEKYIFLILGTILGIAISLYIHAVREERYVQRIKNDQESYSTKMLDNALEKAVQEMQLKMSSLGRKLTEEEKNEIIFGHLEQTKNINQ